MKTLFRRLATVSLFLSLSGVLLFAGDHPAYAAFDANNIIDNSIFDNHTTMSANDIQNFLNGFPSSCLKNYQAPYPIDYFNYGENVSASTVIRRAADLWGINPQVILATLEKEQSLVSGGAGCADWRYNSAIGMGCPDNGACPAPEYAGFSKQVTKGSWQLMFARHRSEGDTAWNSDGSVWYGGYMTAGNRARSDGGQSAYYDGYATIDGSSVYMSNGATAALYTYTPHFHGNQNFVLIFETWFGTAHGTFLLQSPASPAVYLMNGTTRYGIPSEDVLRAYGFSGIKVTPVSNEYMNSLTDGGTLGTTFKKEGSDAIYLADNGYRFGFATQAQCVDWGFPNCLTSASKSLSPYLFNRLYNAGDMKSLMLTGSTVFQMQNGEKRPFLSGKAMTENGYTNSDIVPITNTANNSQSVGYALIENNGLVKFAPRDTIYLYNQGKFYALTYNAFTSLSQGKTTVTDNYSKYSLIAPTTEYTVSPYVRLNNGKSYLFTNGGKLDITATKSEWPTQQDASAVSDAITSAPLTDTVSTNSTYRSVSGAIYSVGAQSMKPFYSLNDYFGLGNTTPITVGNEVQSSLSRGSYILSPGSGSIYQVTTPGKEYLIYTPSSNGAVCQITSVNQLGEFGFSTNAVKRIAEPSGTTVLLSKLVADPAGNLYLVENGNKTTLSKNSLTTFFGINSYSNGCVFNSSFVGAIKPSSQSFGRFLRGANGVIYYGENGQKRPIYSYNAFLRLGGNGSNAPTVPDDLLSLSPTGSPIYE